MRMNTERVKRAVFGVWNRLKTTKLEKLFLVLFLLFGGILVFMIPPGWNTDEPDHTYRIYQLTTGDLLSEKVVSPLGNKAYGGDVAANLVKLYTDAGVRDAGAKAVNKNEKASAMYQQHPNLSSYKDDGQRVSINFSGAALYSPVTYVVYIPIFLLGKLLSLTFLQIIILARLVGLIATGLAFYFAIKHIKMGKWIVFAVGLLPVTVIQAASIGADAPLIAASVLFLAYLTNVLFTDKELTAKHFLILTGLGLLVTLIKLAYAPLVLLILLVPYFNGKFKNRRMIVYALASICIAIIPGLIWTGMVSYIDTNSNLEANFPLQRSFVLHHPFSYLKTVYYTFFTNEQAPLDGLFGNAIWASVPLPAIYSYLALVALTLALFVRDSREFVLKKQKQLQLNVWKGGLLSVSLITALLIATVLYIYSSTLYQSSIIGLQARYFIPLLPFILLAFYGNFVKNQRTVKIFTICIVALILCGMILNVYHRLYQTLPILLR